MAANSNQRREWEAGAHLLSTLFGTLTSHAYGGSPVLTSAERIAVLRARAQVAAAGESLLAALAAEQPKES